MSSWHIFLGRLVRGWKYQYRVIRSIADWTIILYLFIPATVFFLMIYRSWWLKIPEWINNIPLILLFYFLYALAWSGNIRTFVQEGDKVFLIKYKRIFIGMKNWGYAYSVAFQTLQMAVAILIFLPFLRNYYLLDWQEILTVFICFLSMNPAIMLIKYFLRKIESKLKKITAGLLGFVLLGWGIRLIFYLWENGSFAAIYVYSGFILTSTIFRSLSMFKKISTIDEDISIGNEDKMKNINLIFSFSYEIEMPVVSKRRKSLFFRESKRIFNKRSKVNGIIELFIKIFIRNFTYVKGYVQIISVTTAAIIIIPPIWMKALIFSGFLIMTYSWLSLVWERIITSTPLGKKYSESPFYFTARKMAIGVLFILAILILSIFISIWLLAMGYFGIQPGMFK
ncbi:ABC transporter permease [Bacillus sp. S/N-304-OC-R1]|uniref:ABC transporter permease n=1 Tax=Bacillus sp. S/N-304-OC-R1 TaxID=2758034 RepID=UPI001C8D65FA|nr:ABC transporter permease [Bacillus sp. S/N-304-OC-R1]MBY0124153.1 ABC transporter permease [Bacillus sp. S/N-304-OC-R1]